MYQPFNLERDDPALFRLMRAKNTPLAHAKRGIRGDYGLLSKGVSFNYRGVPVDQLPHKDLLKLTKVLMDECIRHRLRNP